MGRKKKEVVRCQVCGAEATHYVLETDCASCDNIVCQGEIERDICRAIEQYKEQEEWERGRNV